MTRDANNGTPRDRARELSEEIRALLALHTFSSREEAQAFVDEFLRQKNRQFLAEFDGLSPEQMYHLLNAPFDSPHLIVFADAPEGCTEAPIMRLLSMIVDAVGDAGLQPTAKGNLPRKLTRSIALAYWGEEGYRENTRFGDLQSEEDFGELYVARLMAEMAGVLRKYRRKFILGRDARKRLDTEGLSSVWLPMLRAFALQFNWAFRSWHDDLPLVQQSFAFTLLLLHRHGDRWRETAFYEDAFLRAFPETLHEVKPTIGTAESHVRGTYRGRALNQAMTMLGLAEMRSLGTRSERHAEIRKLPLLDAAVQFRI